MPENKPSLQLEVQELLLVGAGAVPGALLRWQLALNLGDQNLLVNVLGAGLLGFLAGLPAAPRRQLLLGIGFCGSLTTFSSWMLAAMQQLRVGDWVRGPGFDRADPWAGAGGGCTGFSARPACYTLLIQAATCQL
tara:strand:- start:313 stop:717 length:405 start_codon:yes stop_codon:yes gene_type:complete